MKLWESKGIRWIHGIRDGTTWCERAASGDICDLSLQENCEKRGPFGHFCAKVAWHAPPDRVHTRHASGGLRKLFIVDETRSIAAVFCARSHTSEMNAYCMWLRQQSESFFCRGGCQRSDVTLVRHQRWMSQSHDKCVTRSIPSFESACYPGPCTIFSHKKRGNTFSAQEILVLLLNFALSAVDCAVHLFYNNMFYMHICSESSDVFNGATDVAFCRPNFQCPREVISVRRGLEEISISLK